MGINQCIECGTITKQKNGFIQVMCDRCIEFERKKVEVMYSLPSRKIIEVCNAIAFENPNDKYQFVICKSKYPRITTHTMTKEDFEYFGESSSDPNHQYDELLGKNALIDSKLLNNKGKKLLQELFNCEE